MTRRQKGKGHKRRKSWHRVSDDRRYKRALKLLDKPQQQEALK